MRTQHTLNQYHWTITVQLMFVALVHELNRLRATQALGEHVPLLRRLKAVTQHPEEAMVHCENAVTFSDGVGAVHGSTHAAVTTAACGCTNVNAAPDHTADGPNANLRTPTPNLIVLMDRPLDLAMNTVTANDLGPNAQPLDEINWFTVARGHDGAFADTPIEQVIEAMAMMQQRAMAGHQDESSVIGFDGKANTGGLEAFPIGAEGNAWNLGNIGSNTLLVAGKPSFTPHRPLVQC